MKQITVLLLVMVSSLLLSACGGGSSGASVSSATARGTLIESPPLRVASLNASDLTAQLNATASGQQLLQLSGTPTCGVDFHYIHYWTVGAQGEATTATGVLMVPTTTIGSSATATSATTASSTSAVLCTGSRPIVLYAHGTTTRKDYNLAAVNDATNPASGESALLAAMFAAQGYIVVAPNYAGYDISTLSYHPYLNADQQSKDMIDALSAARSALGHIFASTIADNGKLFVTGYSQGGHVAMATHRALQNAGQSVTAAAPMSGPYALAAMGDAIFFGNVDLGSTVFAPLLTASFQHAYGNIYSATTDIYSPTYATGLDTLLPSTTPLSQLFQQNKLPTTALFNSVPPAQTGNATLDALFPGITPPTTPAAQAPLFALGFASTNFLINNTYRAAYVADALTHPDGAIPTATTGLPSAAPANTLRQAFVANDLRSWLPQAPVLLCGGHADPTVFYFNTQLMQTLWTPQWKLPIPLQVVDVDGGTAPSTSLQQGFAQAEAAISSAAGGGVPGQEALLQAYHGTLVPPFCTVAARQFFNQF